ncbi:MAG TPA: lipid-A-disaccharide synthase [Nitrospiraceae bacterium]|jgi:lipid-A-disaccharide synthase|nr:lipid-A-disaccharide synthase [Nitrospiraceae bacterium]
MPRILIVTGEASGDLHGANLAAAIRGLRPDAQILGVGGSKMKAAGVDLLSGIERLDAMGLVGLAQLRAALGTYRFLARFLREQSLDVVVFIDNPGLNLRLARVAKRAGQRVVYYIAPQIWAWHASRIKLISQVVDRMIVILPFEQELYRRAGITCDFVGHPLLDAVAPSYDRSELRKRFGLDVTARVIGLLPGSREKEVRVHLPLMLQAAGRLARMKPELQFAMAQAASIPKDLIEELSTGTGVTVKIVHDQASEVMAASDLLLVASGTATLQAAVIGTPMIIVYRTTWLTSTIARLVIQVPWIGLVNIVAGRTVAPELIQQEATPARLAEEATRLLRDQQADRDIRAALQAVREQLGEPGASKRAAAAVLAECAA